MTDAAALTARLDPTDLPYELRPFPARGARRTELDNSFAAFLTEESAALDECRYQDWLDLLDERFIYQLPVPLLREDPSLPRHSDRALLFEATKQVLAMKLGRVGLQYAWSDRPSGVMRHFLGAVRVFSAAEPDTWRVDCNVLVTWSRGRDEAVVVTAGRQDLVHCSGRGGYRLLRRRVLLDAEVATHEQLSVIF
ncbi:aromatic-ring-hydroxylating dioxygenase subunit beta [Kitasatospora sp. GP82]|uniref:aromatic-ring-hydroxylating dioxygenase subunit beta n=1 Tax=Kitasatospora sp. GP82 TaxID=3035089 RepID=UPI002475F4EF|nr:aromatic-ring-hydroxylating dioxygenase subunit beta [Kitasatospora sp. GP82]MDH6128347.1 3-phenylpropionate/cinnamic acid dioxygenase small subunit [Kitasatospora sp. GP82]